jgi:hypothetical protein
MFQKTSTKILFTIAVVFVAVSVSLIIVPYYLFPQFYTPKSNPYLGYTAPNTLEGCITLTAALILLALGTILLILCGIRLERNPDFHMLTCVGNLRQIELDFIFLKSYSSIYLF